MGFVSNALVISLRPLVYVWLGPCGCRLLPDSVGEGFEGVVIVEIDALEGQKQPFAHRSPLTNAKTMATAKPTVAISPMISVATACGVQSVYSMGWCPFARSFPRTLWCAGGSSPGATERASGRLAGDQPGGLGSPS